MEQKEFFIQIKPFAEMLTNLNNSDLHSVDT
jgi:hypothetical protein